MRAWRPELDLPDVSDDALTRTVDVWLSPYLTGKRRIEAVQAAELSEALSAMLDYEQRRALDAHAPEELKVPSGMSRRLVYGTRDDDPGAPPVLAVKLQELFGLSDTPQVGDGRVPVMLHLLSPAGRPIQVTQDLAGFWNRTYPEVRKELKGRYPKHPGPTIRGRRRRPIAPSREVHDLHERPVTTDTLWRPGWGLSSACLMACDRRSCSNARPPARTAVHERNRHAPVAPSDAISGIRLRRIRSRALETGTRHRRLRDCRLLDGTGRQRDDACHRSDDCAHSRVLAGERQLRIP